MRLIDADALAEKKFQERECNGLGEDPAYRQGWNDAIDAVMDNEPSAERKGTWIYHTEPLAFRPYGHYTCNLCNEISWDKSNYCPNCGADMRERREDEPNKKM